MSWRSALLPIVNTWLERRDRQIVRRSELERFGALSEPWPAPATRGIVPEGATAYLRSDNPRLADLSRRYRGLDRPMARPSLWTDDYARTGVDFCAFRGDWAYVWQARDQNAPIHYLVTQGYIHRIDNLDLLERLQEDGAFGALTLTVAGGLVVSRDLLDSVIEINFLNEALGLAERREFAVLDVGAGYGRLAHRMVTAFPGSATVLCTDGVALSTFLCEYYLRFRGVADRAITVPLDELDDTLGRHDILLATNVHSFSECPLDAIVGWLDVLSAHHVPYLFIVPNAGTHGGTKLLSLEADESRRDFLPAIEAHGYRLVTAQPKYRDPLVQKYAVSPTCYHLFRLP